MFLIPCCKLASSLKKQTSYLPLCLYTFLQTQSETNKQTKKQTRKKQTTPFQHTRNKHKQKKLLFPEPTPPNPSIPFWLAWHVLAARVCAQTANHILTSELDSILYIKNMQGPIFGQLCWQAVQTFLSKVFSTTFWSKAATFLSKAVLTF